MFDMHGKRVIITGAARGIGRAMVELFAARGAHVAIVDKHQEEGEAVREIIQKKGGEAVFWPIDLLTANAMDQLKRSFLDWSEGALDVLVNNAGIGWREPLTTRPKEEWEEILKLNLSVPYLIVQTFLPYFTEGSAIVNVASTRALMSEPNTEPYSASKGGMVALTHALAVTLGPRVRVNAISPGWIYTGGEVPTSEDHALHPVGRVGRPEDIAYAALFLASQEAGFITGINLVVDGGMTHKMIYP
ncbi:MAG: Oxidoreductase, short chain dehydrogenase/reductase family [Candidatus Carbobacillus altaicus]|uniref:Oxidoreductase, short chain dehydrogenase/reductase family n=1 Tax=Candidatus Carbonibacillus altaicus TaxID=2163959 RepID=A0A2R6XY12_9BACL|nr:MAG: Oxidoreductase, short chain dehydrogenase/reductase family [Candidatus Carbobacillus altaicus]